MNRLIAYWCSCGKKLYTVKNLIVACPGCGQKVEFFSDLQGKIHAEWR